MIFHLKKYRFFAVLAIIFCCNYINYSQAEFPRIVKTYLKLNDNAKNIKEAKIKRAIEILTVGDRQDTLRISEYDTDGFILNEIVRTDTSREKTGEYITRSYKYIYNNFKLLTEKFDSSSVNLKKYYLKYDEFYNITDEELFIQNKSVQKFTYEYDDLSRLIESIQKDMVNDCKIIETYDYNSYNNLVKMIITNKCIQGDNKPVEFKYNYTYDNSYRILEKTTISTAGENKRETFTYTAEGKPETSYELINKDSYINRKYTYDKNSVRIQRTEVKNELSTSTDVLIKYDKSGNRLEEEYYDPAGKLIYTYKFIYSNY